MTEYSRPPSQSQVPRGATGAYPAHRATGQMRAYVPSGPKVLRIGVIQGGRIIDERIVRERRTVTVGVSEKNDFSIPAPQLPPRYELFEYRNNEFRLNLTDDMQGRVASGGEPMDFQALRSSGQAQKRGRFWQVPLTETTRGKVVIGEVTILFQFVAPPPAPARPQLPAAARGGWFRGIDWLFTAFVLFSFFSHFGLLIYLEYKDWPIETGLQAIPDRFTSLLLESPPPQEQPRQEEGVGEEKNKTKEAKNANEDRGKRGKAGDADPEDTARRAAAAHAALVERMARSGINKLIGALGAGSGEVADVLRGGDVGGDQDEIMRQVRGVGVATGEAGMLRSLRGGGAGGGGTVQGLGALASAGGNANVASGGMAEREVRGRAAAERAEAVGGSGELDDAEVRRVINQRMTAVRMCYERQLRRNRQLQGRLNIQLTIGMSGSVSSASAVQNTIGDPDVAACVVSVLRNAHFAAPSGGAVTISVPFVFTPSQ